MPFKELERGSVYSCVVDLVIVLPPCYCDNNQRLIIHTYISYLAYLFDLHQFLEHGGLQPPKQIFPIHAI
jgi:hypothetical protein